MQSHAEMACHDACKECPSGTERDPPYLNLGEKRSYGNDHRQDKNRVRYTLSKYKFLDKIHNKKQIVENLVTNI